MSREIKFRVWCIREGYFIGPDTYLAYQQGLELKGGLINNFKRTNIHDCFVTDFALLQETYYVPEQYVGLKDVNGKELYEGDIVKVIKGVAPFARGFCFIEFGPCGVRFIKTNNTGYDIGVFVNEFEIVGNIHQNPELLK